MTGFWLLAGNLRLQMETLNVTQKYKPLIQNTFTHVNARYRLVYATVSIRG
jgi:hypothetical protein